jgi:hypothetical protein
MSMQRRIRIIRQHLASTSVALLAGGACLLPSAPIRGAEPEVTMRVLDDASEAPTVLAEAVAKQSDGGDPRRASRERRANGADDATRLGDDPDERDGSFELDSVLDREQEGESEIEDRDVPEDIDFEVASEDED